MQSKRPVTIVLPAMLAVAVTASAAPFTPNNLVISQVGDAGHPASANAVPLHIKEINPADADGVIVQDIPLPIVASGMNRRCLGTNYFREHHLKRSTNGLFLTLGGYDCPLGTFQVSIFTAVDVSTLPPRVVARIDPFGTVDTSTALTAIYYGNQSTSGMHSVISTDGRNFWTAGRATSSGNQGIRYASYRNPLSVKLNSSGTDPRDVDIFAGQLYAIFNDSGKRGPFTIGTGVPTTSGQVRTWVPNVTSPDGTESGSPYEELWRDADTVYTTDDRKPEGMGGVNKFVRDTDPLSPNFGLMLYQYTLQGGLRPAAQTVKTMTGRMTEQGQFEIFAITAEEQSGAFQNRLMRVVDTGCGMVPAPTTKVPTLVAGCAAADTFVTVQTSPTGTNFRGVAFTPRACVGEECLGQCCTRTGCSDTTREACSGNWQGLGTSCALGDVCPLVCGNPFADDDGDGDVDMDDFGSFQHCFTGGATPVGAGCICFDRPEAGFPTGNGFIDQADFNAFLNCASHAGVPADPTCDD